ncbi:hypothetical protein CPB83DRAFT_895571 [Crepidotus variabilis]|uniref:Uncharacterized protein n=1 Tax=Crepidotus variabilis TaxID=179855 RepID=A0A9P6JNH3_9AGAR|nr:hypothetical protein CPB83DRAFT_895571 [Crepidotus variabilis]
MSLMAKTPGSPKRAEHPYSKNRSKARRPSKKSAIAKPDVAAALASFRKNVDNTGTIQAVFTEIALKKFPDFSPRNDYDVFIVTGPVPDNLATDNASLYHFVDKELEELIAGSRSPEQSLKDALDLVEKLFSMPGDEMIGLKPRAGDTHVLIRSIPHADYAIRIWPSSPSRRLFCLDFVSATYGQAIDTPPGVELWMTPASNLPMRQLLTIEKTYSPLLGPQTKVEVGAEKYISKEKHDIVLKRPGEDYIILRIPPHPSPPPAPVMNGRIVQVIDFSYPVV